jgi:hypothetical protein
VRWREERGGEGATGRGGDRRPIEAILKKGPGEGENQELQRSPSLSSRNGCGDADLRVNQEVSGRRKVFDGRPDATLFPLSVYEYWRGLAKTRYEAHFISKLSDSEGEAEETRVWLEFAWRCGYTTLEERDELDDTYDKILGQLVRMIDHPDQWTIH